MLYNPKWQETKTKYPRFVRWLAQQPADKAYDYCDSRRCGYAQYLRSIGVYAIVSSTSWYGLWLGLLPVWGIVPHEINWALIQQPTTFGDALQRLKG